MSCTPSPSVAQTLLAIVGTIVIVYVAAVVLAYAEKYYKNKGRKK